MSADIPSPALAHIRDDGAQTQTVAEHLLGTAALCRRFAAAFDAADYGDAAAKLHDIGKYSTGFQRRLRGGAKVDHSTAGAQQAWQRRWAEIAFAVAGHHGGLPDGGARTDDAGYVGGGAVQSRPPRGGRGLKSSNQGMSAISVCVVLLAEDVD